jgi:hypothetical protein
MDLSGLHKKGVQLVFGDQDETYIKKFEERLEDFTLEDLLEQEDLEPAQALYLLFTHGYIKDPFERSSCL